jgi:hypothetical protein
MRAPRGLRIILTLGVAALLPSCVTRDPSSGSATVTRDSVGISIVENGTVTLPALATWTLSEEPSVVIGETEEDPGHLLNQVVGAFRLGDGGIVIGDRGSGEVRFFTAEGRHLRTVGGQGEGPGEFRLLMAIDVMPGDTVVAAAWPLGRRSWWDSRGEHIADTESGLWGPGLVGGRTLPDGTFLIDTYDNGSYGNSIELWAATGEGDTFRTQGVLLRVTRAGVPQDTLGTVVGAEYFKTGQLGQIGSFANHTLPYTNRTHLAYNDGRIYLGESHLGEVRGYSYDGTLTHLIRWQPEHSPVTGADRAAFRREVLEGLRDPTRRPAFERWLSAVPYPESKPAFRGIATDRAGRLWVEAWTATEGANRWLVFERDGALSATVQAPGDARLRDAGEDYVIVSMEDELGVETVRLFGLHKG